MSTAFNNTWVRAQADWLEECTDISKLCTLRGYYRRMLAEVLIGSKGRHSRFALSSLIEIADMRILENADKKGRNENPCTEI